MRIRFGISSVLILATLVAIVMFVLGECARYRREHVDVRVYEKVTGFELSRFKYRVAIVTEHTGLQPHWSEWNAYQSKGNEHLTLKVPAHCRLMVEAQAACYPNQSHSHVESMLVHPAGRHQLMLSIDGHRMKGIVLDDATHRPIHCAKIRIVPHSDYAFGPQQFNTDVLTDSNGHFEIYSSSPAVEFAVVHPHYQYRFERASGKQETIIYLKPGRQVRGRVLDQETEQPIKDCLVEVQYFTGVSISDPAQLAELDPDDGTVARLRAGNWTRHTKTDADGNYELYMESRAANCRIRFIKDGWDTSVRSSLAVDSQPVHLWRLGIAKRSELSGKVVDRDGHPIPRFRIVTKRDEKKHSDPLMEHAFEDTDGRFVIKDFLHCHGYVVEAEGFAREYAGSFKPTFYRGGPPPSPLPSSPGGKIQLVPGESIQGSIKSTQKHTLPVDIYLTDLRTCQDLDQTGPPEWAERSIHDSDSMAWAHAEPLPNILQYHLRPESSGDFEFKHLANGIYALLVQYNHQTVGFRPVVIENQSVVLPEIELPALGSIHGTLSSSESPDVRSGDAERENAFGGFQLVRAGDPWGKFFRTDYRSGFSLNHVLVGDMKIGRVGSWKKDTTLKRYSDPIGFDFSLREGQDKLVSNESVVVHELHVYNNDTAGFHLHMSKLHGETDAIARFTKLPTRGSGGLSKWQVLASKDLPSGAYSLDLGKGESTLSTTFDYQRQRSPSVTVIHLDSIPAKMGSIVYYPPCRITFHQKGKQVGAAQRPPGPYTSNSPSSLMAWMIDALGPCDVVLQEPGSGWAIARNALINQNLDLAEATIKPGTRLYIYLNLHVLDLFPTELNLQHHETGASIHHPLDREYCYGGQVTMDHLMRGKWTLTLSGIYPSNGQRFTSTKEVEVREPVAEVTIPDR